MRGRSHRPAGSRSQRAAIGCDRSTRRARTTFGSSCLVLADVGLPGGRLRHRGRDAGRGRDGVPSPGQRRNARPAPRRHHGVRGGVDRSRHASLTKATGARSRDRSPSCDCGRSTAARGRDRRSQPGTARSGSPSGRGLRARCAPADLSIVPAHAPDRLRPGRTGGAHRAVAHHPNPSFGSLAARRQGRRRPLIWPPSPDTSLPGHPAPSGPQSTHQPSRTRHRVANSVPRGVSLGRVGVSRGGGPRGPTPCGRRPRSRPSHTPSPAVAGA
jgi:hypothetical protein